MKRIQTHIIYTDRKNDASLLSIRCISKKWRYRKAEPKKNYHQVIEWLTNFDPKKLHGTYQGRCDFRNILPTGFAKPQCAPHHRSNLWGSCGGNRESFDAHKFGIWISWWMSLGEGQETWRRFCMARKVL